MKKLLVLFPMVLALNGCASQEAIPQAPAPVASVKIALPVSCITSKIDTPQFLTDADLAGMGDYELVMSLAKDRDLRISYESKLEALLAGCE